MSTPVAPTLTFTFDKPSYSPNDVVTATGVYTDENGTSFPVVATMEVTDTATPPNTASAQAAFQVVTAAGQTMTATITDTAGDLYTLVSNAGGQVVFTTTAPSAP
jgi:hypothetical protein